MRRSPAVDPPPRPGTAPGGRAPTPDDVLVDADALQEMIELLSLYRHGLRTGVTDRDRSERAGAVLDRFGAWADRHGRRGLPPQSDEPVQTTGKSLGEVATALHDRLSGVEYVVPGRSGSAAPWPTDVRWIACYAVTGANEGHYVHVDAIRTHSRGPSTVQQLLIVKVLTGREAALAVSALCARVLQAA